MPNISIQITKDTATPALREQMAALTPARLAARMGPPVQDLVEKWLAKLGPNKMGFPSTGFYEKFAGNVRWTPQPDGVIVGILPVVIHGQSVGLRQRVEGGPIAPVTAKALAIPLCAEAYGHVPGDFDGLLLVKTAKGAYLVAKGEISPATGSVRLSQGKTKKRGKPNTGALIFMFKLSFGVDQPGDRTVLPSDQEITETALKAIGAAENN